MVSGCTPALEANCLSASVISMKRALASTSRKPSASAPSEFSATVRTASSNVEPAAIEMDMRSSALGSSRSMLLRHSRRF